jgi:hypothetical protein
MEYRQRFQVKRLQECVDGELIRYGSNDIGRLGIVVQKDERQDYLTLAVLDSQDPNFAGPEMDGFNAQGRCISYGADWVLEFVDGTETWPSNSAQIDQRGTIRVFEESTGLVVGRIDRNLPRAGLIDLKNLRVIRRERYEGALITRWRIWLNEEERGRVGAMPILDFGAKA